MQIRIIMVFLFMGLITETGAELHDRGGGMIYDDVLNITWLQDANAGAGSVYDDGSNTSDGRMTWENAVAWADTLMYGGFDDWRLPSMDVNGDDSYFIISCRLASEVACRDNELGYMFYQNLMGIYGDNLTGDQNLFTNIQAGQWSGTETTPSPFEPFGRRAWVFIFSYGSQVLGDESYIGAAWAVRPGDVAQGDSDDDGFINAIDNCTFVANSDQRDTDSDGFGNVCDFDYDNNCVTNFFDLIDFAFSFGSMAGDPNFNDNVDNNGDGFINFLDFGVPPDNFSAFFANPPGPSATECVPAL